ncbi:MAG: GNAT family N-acetyltransferase [Candidatus Eisenbacteria bacterium]|uniref:GNAT family N-acetyltransferase n=1 Tax=Eiseniibacteriota bacterium TaxID=2212470 RepID=A0A956SBI0_UNCEI|nr:GNAT family N-acetyltransferase [Candidatus Eisenbacteria bacterium]MCB9466230.1 GNAT family N-acetyltransferase [Candidatus Eisenbacteria bacterium]
MSSSETTRSSTFLAPDRWETPEFVLRSFRPGDGARLAAALNSSYDHLHRFMLWAIPNEDPDEVEQRVRRFHARYLLHEDFIIGILSPDESEVLGGTGFHLREGPLEQKRCEAGMWIRADLAGSGLGKRVLAALLDWAWTEWHWERISWHCSTQNVASARVAESAGLTREGTLRAALTVRGEEPHDLHVYSILRKERI